MQHKYFNTIDELEARSPAAGHTIAAPFDFAQFVPSTLMARCAGWIFAWLFQAVLALFWGLRNLAPAPRIPFVKIVLVMRDKDIREVLADTRRFLAPFGPEMRQLSGGGDFVLGLDGPEHDRQRRAIEASLRAEDIDWIAARSRALGERLLAAGGGTIDVARGYFRRASAETCCELFGLEAVDLDGFGDWTYSVSNLLFADPFGSARNRDAGLAGAARLRDVIARAIHRLRAAGGDEDSFVGRLILYRDPETGAALDDGAITAIVVGMASGFAPTITMAAVHGLQSLASRGPWFERARALARAGDADGLRKIVWEAARLGPALQPGQWRYVAEDAVIAGGARRVRKGDLLAVATQYGLKDPEAWPDPLKFEPGRGGDPAADRLGSMMFGLGLHRCVGARLAKAQLDGLFLELLARPNLRPAEALITAGPFPWRWHWTYSA
jgi:cytochrome P450